MREGIYASGNFIVDRVKIVDTYPEQDNLALIDSVQVYNGGGPYNLLVDLARLGATYPLIAGGTIGSDDDGRWILADCNSKGIDTRYIRTTEEAGTSFTDAMSVATTGRRTFFHYVGANAHFDSLSDLPLEAQCIYLGYLRLLPSLEQRVHGELGALTFLRRASATGAVVAVDCVSAQRPDLDGFVMECLPEVDILFTNERELASALQSSHPHLAQGVAEHADARTLHDAQRALIDNGLRLASIVHTPSAAYFMTVDRDEGHVPSLSIPLERIQGATGAGDAFAAGFLHSYLTQGIGGLEDWLAACHAGNCVAAACLHHPSASNGILPFDQCLALADELD